MAIAEGGGVSPVAEERERRHISRDSKSSKENSSDATDMVTREKRAPKLRGDGETK